MVNLNSLISIDLLREEYSKQDVCLLFQPKALLRRGVHVEAQYLQLPN